MWKTLRRHGWQYITKKLKFKLKIGTAELTPVHFLMHCKTTHSPSERLPPQETAATNTVAEEVRLEGSMKQAGKGVRIHACVYLQ